MKRGNRAGIERKQTRSNKQSTTTQEPKSSSLSRKADKLLEKTFSPKQKQQKLDESFPLARNQLNMKKQSKKPTTKKAKEQQQSGTAKSTDIKTKKQPISTAKELKDQPQETKVSKLPGLEEAEARHTKSSNVEKKEKKPSPKEVGIQQTLVTSKIAMFVHETQPTANIASPVKGDKMKAVNLILSKLDFSKLNTDEKLQVAGLLGNAVGGEIAVKTINRQTKELGKLAETTPKKSLFDSDEEEEEEEEEVEEEEFENDQAATTVGRLYKNTNNNVSKILLTLSILIYKLI